MALTYTQITSTTLDYIMPKVVNNIYNSAALIARLNRKGKKRYVDGGSKLRFPIIKSEAGVGGFYADLDTLDISRSDDMTSAEYEWVQAFEPIRISGREMMQNSGKSAIVNLVTAKGEIAQLNMAETLSDGLQSAGSGSDKDVMAGLDSIMASSGTHGNIATTDLASWAASIKNSSGSNTPVSLSLMQQLEGSVTEGGKQKPTSYVCKQDLYDQIWGLFQPHQRLMSEEMAKLGFENILTFNGKPIIVDSHAPSGILQILNEDYLFLAVHPRRDLIKEKFDKLETSDSILYRILWGGNLICNNRRAQGELQNLAVAS